MRIHILTNHDFISYFFMYPLLAAKEKLREANVEIRYFDKIDTRLFACDALFLDSKFFRELWAAKDRCLSLIRKMGEKCDSLIWLDTTDSTGGTHFQVLPYVDKYFKKQLLKDISLYETQYYGARIYTDYYNKKFGVEDIDVYSVEPLDPRYTYKLGCSWNLGLGPTSANNRISRIMRRIPWKVKEKMRFGSGVTYHRPCEPRQNRICFRGSVEYVNRVLSYQRMKVATKLKQRGVSTKPVRHEEYMDELKNSVIGVSPFGSGEICFRDFEIVLAGAVLLKPRMEHVETYPQFFVENKTYVPFDWDFSDFEEKIDFLLGNRKKAEKISDQAQEQYVYFCSKEGREQFCKRFLEMVRVSRE